MMVVKIFCPIWGMVPDYVEAIDGSLEGVLETIKAAGYDGVEMAVPFSDKQKARIAELLKAFQLEHIALQWAANGNTLTEYLSSYERHIRNAADLAPLFINSHTGKDHYTFDEVCPILDRAGALSEALNIKIVHETHRGKFSFHSAVIQQYLRTYPQLRLAADFSHWCNVSESYLQDQVENLANAVERTDHIHARVGHPQAPQVSDPRAPEWKEALDHHLAWWDAVIALHRERGTAVVTITPEFGPGYYMPLLPFTRKPVSDQWEINLWMKALLKERYHAVPAVGI